MKFTNEQKEIMQYVTEKQGMLLVPAGAGCGKTFIAQEIVQNMNPANGLYTAFNKPIVQEAEEKFMGFNVTCKTLHALAYRYVKPKRDGVQELSYKCITEDFSYPEKAMLIDGINLFFVSSSTDMYTFFDEYFTDKFAAHKNVAVKYVTLMQKKQMPMSFNFMLKSFHLMMHEGVKVKYDIVILDEINDTTAVALEIFKLIDSPIKIGLGESNQAIYHFLNLKDGFKELSDAKTLPLTNSFRCSTTIASDIENFMHNWVDPNFQFKGTNTPVQNGNTLYVTMTNAAIVHIIKDRLSVNKSFTLLRKISEIFAYPLAIVGAGKGKEVYQHKYKFLEKEYKNCVKYNQRASSYLSFYNYLLQVVDDQETKSAVALLSTLASQNTNIYDLYRTAKSVLPDPKYTISTVFTSKGLEFETVYINDDMNRRISTIIENGGIASEEDLVAFRCYYVACSRAGENLHNATQLFVENNTKKEVPK